MEEGWRKVGGRLDSSVPRKINEQGPEVETIWLLEYLSQSNNCADIVTVKVTDFVFLMTSQYWK